MALPLHPHKERPSTYVVQDRSSQEELRRLQLQDPLITDALGGVLPEQPDPASLSSVLDVGCGSGKWLVEVAKTYPTISQLLGVDISRRMVEASREEAKAQQVQERVTFRVMDALDLSELPEDTFDLTNLRQAESFLRTWEWPKALSQLKYATRPGGIVRLTEADLPDQSSSPALLHLFGLLAQAYNQAGRYFQIQSKGVAGDLANLLAQQGLVKIQTYVHRPVVQAGTKQGQLFWENMQLLFRTNVPFILKWAKMPADYEQLYKQMLREIQQPDFFATNQVITAWGYKAPAWSAASL